MSYERFLTVDDEGNEVEYGSFEVFKCPEDYPLSVESFEEPGTFADDDEGVPSGWYWAAGFGGCLWDSDPIGPFKTEAEAIADARQY